MVAELGTGRIHSGEGYYFTGPPAAAWNVMKKVPLLIYAHGATGSASLSASSPTEQFYFRKLMRHFFVLAGDFAGDSCANDTAIARVEEARLWAGANFNVDIDTIGLSGMSMGFGTITAWARANPTKYKFAAGVIPMVDINDIKVNNRGGLAATVNAAYGGNYVDSTDGPNHSPIKFAASLTKDIAIWTSSNDTYIPPAVTDTFMAVRPATQRTNIGAVAHSSASLTPLTAAQMAAWCVERKDL